MLYLSLACGIDRSLCEEFAHVFIFGCDLEVESDQVLLVREHKFGSYSAIAVS